MLQLAADGLDLGPKLITNLLDKVLVLRAHGSGGAGFAVARLPFGARWMTRFQARLDPLTAWCVADGYGFQVEMTHRLVRSGGRVVEIPITFRDRTQGESKLSYRIIGEAFRLVMRLAWRDLGLRLRPRRS